MTNETGRESEGEFMESEGESIFDEKVGRKRKLHADVKKWLIILICCFAFLDFYIYYILF